MKKIIILGSANVDISARTARYPVAGESVVGESVLIGMGGKGSNQATAASRLGADVCMIAKLGRDFFASIPEAHYKNEHIDTRFVTYDETAGTGTALIEVLTGSGENRITVVPGANHTITDAEVAAAEEEIRSADVLLTQLETNPSSIAVFMKLAKKYGKPVILNPAPAAPIPEDWYPLIDTITPNETEACSYTGITVDTENVTETAKKAAAVFHERGIPHVIITCGSKGVFLSDLDAETGNRTETVVPTNRVQAVDTTGAGDCFNGAFAAALAEGFSRIEACRFACCAATVSVTRAGAASSMPTRAETDILYNRYYHSGKRIDARAKMLANEHGIFWRAIDGTGEGGLITENDVRKLL